MNDRCTTIWKHFGTDVEKSDNVYLADVHSI